MKVSQEPSKISDILKDKIFKIPIYQREYSWSLDEISDLFYDINESEDNGHFLGSLLLYKENDSNKAEIVDGQQRITTLFLLLFCILVQLKELNNNKRALERITELLFIRDPNDLSDKINSSEPRLEIGKRDNKLFKTIIRGEDYFIYKDGRKKSHKNLTNALDFFNEKIEELRNTQNNLSEKDPLVEFAEKVIKSEFIVMTAEKKSDKLLLFKTINARGLELTQGDLIKNELCQNLGVDSIEIDDYVDQWDMIRKGIEDHKGNFDSFLFHYINSRDDAQKLRQELDKKRGTTKWDKKNYPPVPEKYIFDIYSELIKKDGGKMFIEEMFLASKNYKEIINPSPDKIYLNSLKLMGVNKCFPLILKSMKVFNDKEFNRICKGIEAITFRHSILRKDPKELERFYYILSDLIIENSSIEEVILKIKEHNNFREEEKFKNEFIISSPKGSISKMILDRIVRGEAESIDWNNKDVHIEHIMPQKPKGEWKVLYDDDENEYKDYLNRLGNLTILQDKKNIKARNKDFNDKKEFYKTSRISITNNIVKYNKWGYNEILERQIELYELSKKIWIAD